jgi:diguanylate cyclase (GGDEF)-like protein/PAS domain S-box-containing protein
MQAQFHNSQCKECPTGMTVVTAENEADRLKALRELAIEYVGRLPEFEAIAETTAAIFNCPIALISIVEADKQDLLSRVGLDVDCLPRDETFCQHTILTDTPLIVADARDDNRFRDLPIVTQEPAVRFYAGVPLSLDGIHRMGTLCVMGPAPKSVSATELAQLSRMRKVVEGFLSMHCVNERAHATLQLAQQEHQIAALEHELLDEITHVSGVGGWELDLKTNVLTWTDKTREIHEVPPDYEPSLETAVSFYKEQARDLIKAAVAEGIENRQSWDLELPFVTARGRDIWARAVGRPIVEDGEVVRLVGAVQDVTERRRSEEAIRQSEAVQRTVLETMSEGILLIGKRGRIHSVNTAAAAFFGKTAAELNGKLVRDLDICLRFETGDETSVGTVLQLAATQPEMARNLTVCLAAGEHNGEIWLQIETQPILENNEATTLDGVVVSMKNITGVRNQEKTLQAIFDNFPGGIVYHDENMRLTACNEAYRNMFDIPAGFIRQRPHRDDCLLFLARRGDYGPGDPEKIVADRIKAIGSGEPVVHQRVAADGTFIETRSTPLPNGGAVFSFFDITARKRMEDRLLENERFARERSEELEVILANMRQGVSVFDRNGCLTLWNRQYLEIFGKPAGEIRQGISLLEILAAEVERGEFTGDPQEHFNEVMWRLHSGEVVRSTFEHPNGKIISAIHAPLPGGGWIGTHEDVTLREQAAQKIVYAAHHDTLTGLANRTLFNKRLEEAHRTACLEKIQSDLMLLDLDNFKPVNDTHGHIAGDELLVEVADRLGKCVRSTDLVARLGGDEFGIILNGMQHDMIGIGEIASRVVRNLRAPFHIAGQEISVSASIGISPIKSDASTISQIIKKADIALYEVKKNGRNGYRFSDDIKAVDASLPVVGKRAAR